MTYTEAIAFLYDLRLFGTKFGLENTRELARLNGNPHEHLRFIHVAGTNGKGSTCAILESIYRAQGLRTGLFTSPHLVSFTERIQINRAPIAEPDVPRLTQALIDSLGGADLESWPFRPTFFEFVTVMALVYFREQQCDVVIWETGMGGRLDATNIVSPLASVITNIQMDHQHWLGNTLEQIAMEKAGIIKPGVPVITGTDSEPALAVIRTIAEAHRAPLITISEARNYDEILVKLPLLGAHQVRNATLACTVVSTLAPALRVTPEALQLGIQTVRWAGRFQVVQRGSSRILLDGAHNPDGMKSLATAIQQHFAAPQKTLIFGLFRDKAWQEMCEIMVPLAHRLLLVPVASERTADADEVQQYCMARWPNVQTRKCSNLAAAIHDAAPDPFVIITGSLHLIGEAMELLGVSPSGRSERLLNEWDAANTASAPAI